ncbi:MAG: GNAT family N-acetyltransferase [Lachnospiraceae bacterium]|nr:GNAT family N-acetyltransferase [Lachnospiraceae bacterium]
MIIWQNEAQNEKIDALTRLVPKKQFALLALNDTCRDHDGTFSGVELEAGYKPDRHFRSFFLYYEGKRLIGELFLFLSDVSTAEITAIVDPCCRKRGIFTKLLRAAEEELDKYGIEVRYFVVEPECEEAKKVAEHLQLKTEYSELVMELATEEVGKILYKNEMNGNSSDDHHKTCKVDFGNFLSGEKLINERIDVEDDTFTSNIESSDGTGSIGTVHACITGDSAFIYDVMVDEAYRRQGFGRRLVSGLIERIREEMPDKKIKLQVSSNNVPAVELYRKLGFETVSSITFMRR